MSVTSWGAGNRGFDVSIRNAACTSGCCSMMLLLVSVCMVVTEEKDQETTRPACSEMTAHPLTQERTSKQNDGFQQKNR